MEAFSMVTRVFIVHGVTMGNLFSSAQVAPVGASPSDFGPRMAMQPSFTSSVAFCATFAESDAVSR